MAPRKKSSETDSFSDQYKHPNWQKKRLEILERDNWTCVKCGAKDEQLHVHHAYYMKDLKVWEYWNETLFTLCDECHECVHSEINTFEYIYRRLKMKACLPDIEGEDKLDLNWLEWYVAALERFCSTKYMEDAVLKAVDGFLDSIENILLARGIDEASE